MKQIRFKRLFLVSTVTGGRKQCSWSVMGSYKFAYWTQSRSSKFHCSIPHVPGSQNESEDTTNGRSDGDPAGRPRRGENMYGATRTVLN